MMSEFLGDDYLLSTPAARDLYAVAAAESVVDAHNHADVAEIRANAPYRDIWQIEASTDHYVWSALRKCGVPESLITGTTTSPRQKWRSAAAVFDQLAGNATYEWVHLDLKRLLGIDALISAETADAIWDEAAAVLQHEEMRPQALLARMRVVAMCSTDDPIDSLADHQALAQAGIGTRVLPTFRPDKAMNIFADGWREYIGQLGERVNSSLRTLPDVIAALRTCHDYFAEHGCVASDHGVEVPLGRNVAAADADGVFRRALAGEPLAAAEVEAYMSYMLQEMAALDAEKGWVFQLHLGAVRNVRDGLMAEIGPDSGGDVSSHAIDIVAPVRDLLNRFDGQLKVVLYCLHPGHQPTLTTLARAFGGSVRLGSAWWFNDTPVGMHQQLSYIAGLDLLSAHVGMVSDSRKLMSYGSRHEMFRRVLADVVGGMVTQGRVPMAAAEPLVRRVACDNSRTFFGL
jgi:glucuronate isomerase